MNTNEHKNSSEIHLSAKRMRCHLNNTPDLLVDVEYQDGIIVTTFISVINIGIGYAKIDVFKGNRYIGHTGAIVHFKEEKLSEPIDYGEAALPYIQDAVEQLLKHTYTTFDDTVVDLFVHNHVKLSAGSEFSLREAYELFIRCTDDLKTNYLDEETFYKQLNKAMTVKYRVVSRGIIHGISTRGFKGFELVDSEQTDHKE